LTAPPPNVKYQGTGKKSKAEIAFEQSVLADDHKAQIEKISKISKARDMIQDIGMGYFGQNKAHEVVSPGSTTV
jgi:hypothetical protein